MTEQNKGETVSNATQGQGDGARSEKTGYVIGVVSICIGSLGCAWSVFGGMCCNWGGIPLGFIALVLGIVSLVFRRGKAGWWGLGLGIGAIVLWFLVVALFNAQLENMNQGLLKP